MESTIKVTPVIIYAFYVRVNLDSYRVFCADFNIITAIRYSSQQDQGNQSPYIYGWQRNKGGGY